MTKGIKTFGHFERHLPPLYRQKLSSMYTFDTDEERINVPCTETYGRDWKEKQAILMLGLRMASNFREFIKAL